MGKILKYPIDEFNKKVIIIESSVSKIKIDLDNIYYIMKKLISVKGYKKGKEIDL